jgi:hypothetical protein
MSTPSSEGDVVAMPSLKSDGTPDQTPDYKVLHPDTGEQVPASEFTEFRAVTQETVLPPPETDAAAGMPDDVQGATPEESTGVPGTSEAAAESQVDPVAAREPDEPAATGTEAAPSQAATEAAAATGTETRPSGEETPADAGTPTDTSTDTGTGKAGGK